MTGIVPVMWLVWGVLVVFMLALKLYSGRLSRNEDDHLVLDPAFDNIRAEQDAIMAKLHRLEPLRKVLLGLAIGATVFVVGYYAMDVMSQFK
jgi:ribosomal 50S subunit-associated protein YjgA (DUF615 family)